MGYIRQVLETLSVRLVLIPVGMLASLVVARWLGPHDLGIYAAVGAIIGTMTTVGNLGLPLAAMRHAAAHPEDSPGVIANARWSGFIVGLAILLGLTVWLRVFPSSFGEVPPTLLYLAALALPFSFASSQFQGVVVGLKRFRHYNLVEALNRVSVLLGAVVALIAFGGGVKALLLWTVAMAVAQFVLYQILLRPASWAWRPHFALGRALAGISARSWLTVLFYYLVLRVDILLINLLREPASSGVYSVAVQGIDSLLLLPMVATTVLFPRIAEDASDRSAHLTAIVCRHTVFAMATFVLITAVAAPWAVPILFGTAYVGAVEPLWILLPGAWAMAILNILYGDLGGRKCPVFVPLAWGLTLALNIGLNMLFIPRWGISGAAAASTLSYGVCLVLIGRFWLSRFSNVRLRDLILLNREEVRAIGPRLKTVLFGG